MTLKMTLAAKGAEGLLGELSGARSEAYPPERIVLTGQRRML